MKTKSLGLLKGLAKTDCSPRSLSMKKILEMFAAGAIGLIVTLTFVYVEVNDKTPLTVTQFLTDLIH